MLLTEREPDLTRAEIDECLTYHTAYWIQARRQGEEHAAAAAFRRIDRLLDSRLSVTT